MILEEFFNNMWCNGEYRVIMNTYSFDIYKKKGHGYAFIATMPIVEFSSGNDLWEHVQNFIPDDEK